MSFFRLKFTLQSTCNVHSSIIETGKSFRLAINASLIFLSLGFVSSSRSAVSDKDGKKFASNFHLKESLEREEKSPKTEVSSENDDFFYKRRHSLEKKKLF
jgi:hypothetical protein